MLHQRRKDYLRKVKAGIRDTLILIREFQWPLLLFLIVIIGGGYLYWLFAAGTNQETISLPQALYHVLGLVFLQPSLDFPNQWYLQIFYFALPILGIGILAQGVADFGVLFFNRKARSKE